MPAAGACVPTRRAADYAERLCRGFADNAPARLEGCEGRIDLPLGPCHLSVGDRSLALLVEAADAEALANLQWVVTSRLKRFAIRETVQVEWRPA